jgi:hypothetical protein
MTLLRIDLSAARARLNQVGCPGSIRDLATALVRWQYARGREDPGALLVPIAVPLPPAGKRSAGDTVQMPSVSAPGNGTARFRNRARSIRLLIADRLGVTDEALLDQITFTQTSSHAWYLGPRPELTLQAAVGAVGSSTETAQHYVRLALLKELAARAALDADDIFIRAGFGPLVYLGVRAQKGSVLRMFEVDFQIAEHGGNTTVTCLVHAKAFGHRGRADNDPAHGDAPVQTRFISIGEGMLEQVSRINPRHFVEIDARRRPVVGIVLQSDRMRHSRLYFLNIATEFAMSVLREAGVAAGYETFTATHVVEGGYIPLDDLADLVRPLEIVAPFRGDAELTAKVLTRFQEWPAYLGQHTVGKRKTTFETPQVQTMEAAFDADFGSGGSLLAPALDRLILSEPTATDSTEQDTQDSGPESSTVRVWRRDAAGVESAAVEVSPDTAYELLAQGKAKADAYTQMKFVHVMNRDQVERVIQGIDVSLQSIASLRTVAVSKADATTGARERLGKETSLREAIKRCLVELSLKECLVGAKPVPVESLAAFNGSLDGVYTLIATKRIRLDVRKELVATVDIQISGTEILVTGMKRTPWSRSAAAALGMCFDYPFLQSPAKNGATTGPIRDGQFWVLDKASGNRLAAWRGDFVPKIILNDVYPTIERALRLQEDEHASKTGGMAGVGHGGLKFYSKGRDANLVPYYMSMRAADQQIGAENVGSKVAVQDCGAFVRVFVPPADSLKGAGNPLSGMRDVMVYRGDGQAIESGLLDHPMIVAYLHTMTTGILVGGDNSKMSVLEKLARLALEN